MFCEHHKSTKYARYRYLLEAKLFLHPLNRGEGDIAELGDIPQAPALATDGSRCSRAPFPRKT